MPQDIIKMKAPAQQRLMSSTTGQDLRTVEKTLDRDHFLTADEAMGFGLIGPGGSISVSTSSMGLGPGAFEFFDLNGAAFSQPLRFSYNTFFPLWLGWAARAYERAKEWMLSLMFQILWRSIVRMTGIFRLPPAFRLFTLRFGLCNPRDCLYASNVTAL